MRRYLGQQAGAVLELALAVTPAGAATAAWREGLARFEVPPLGDAERFAVAEREGQTRGAPVEEVRRCLARLVEWVEASHPLARQALGGLLTDLVARHVAQYRELATAQPAPAAAGGMFAHAQATADRKAREGSAGGGAHVLRCAACGAPRLREADLRCDYCGGQTLR